jgi:hypothetical protein
MSVTKMCEIGNIKTHLCGEHMHRSYEVLDDCFFGRNIRLHTDLGRVDAQSLCAPSQNLWLVCFLSREGEQVHGHSDE